MTDLAQTALDFCRLCLGWERPVDRRFDETSRNATGDGPSLAWTPYIFDCYGKHPQFHYTDLNAVMAAVQEFCTRNELFISCCRAPGVRTWQVVLFKHGLETRFGVDFPDITHALLAACVEAARKLKA